MRQNKIDRNASEHDLLVFEERHKAYGAFENRSKYIHRLKKGFVYTLLFIVLLLLLPWIVKLFSRNERMLVSVDISDAPGSSVQLPEPPGLDKKETISNAPAKKLAIPEIKEKVLNDTATKTSVNPSGDANSASENTSTGNGKNGNEFSQLEVNPSFPGGMEKANEFIRQNINYNANDRKNGTVIIGFEVGADGILRDIHVIKSVSPELDKASLDVIKLMNEMTEWNPGRQNGKNVDKVPAQISINFTTR